MRNVWVSSGRGLWYCGDNPCTKGQYIFLNGAQPSAPLMSHEYIHVLQYEGRGADFETSYVAHLLGLHGSGASNPEEAVGYLWQVWISKFPTEVRPWNVWTRPA